MNALPDTFRAVIDAHASTQPSAPFLRAPEPGIDIDYATLGKNCVAFAALLDGLGIAPGATVSFMLQNGLSAATVFLGAMYGGYVVSPINLLAHDAQVGVRFAGLRTQLDALPVSFGGRLETSRFLVRKRQVEPPFEVARDGAHQQGAELRSERMLACRTGPRCEAFERHRGIRTQLEKMLGAGRPVSGDASRTPQSRASREDSASPP